MSELLLVVYIMIFSLPTVKDMAQHVMNTLKFCWKSGTNTKAANTPKLARIPNIAKVMKAWVTICQSEIKKGTRIMIS